MYIDYTSIYKKISQLRSEERYDDAISILLWLADQDQSFDDGTIAYLLALTYENLKKDMCAKFWYGVALRNNPGVPHYQEARAALEHINVDSIIAPNEYLREPKSK